MAYIPPVNIPSLSDRDYSGRIFGVLSGVGDAFYQNRRDVVADEQWGKNYARLLAGDEFDRQMAERDYALDLRRLELDEAKARADAAAGGGEDEWYGTPQWFQRENPDGSVTMGYGIISKSGAFKEMPPPEGTEWAPTVTFQDTGTARVPMYTRGGSQAGDPLPVDVAGKQREEEIGTAGGKLTASLPIIEASTDRMIRGIDEALQDPMLSSVTGPAGGRLPTWVSTDPGGASRAQSRIDFILGNTFLQAYNDLRGAGQITEREGQAAMEAYSRLRTQAMSDDDYVRALMDLRNEIVKLYEIARERAQMGASGGEPVTMPSGRVIQRID